MTALPPASFSNFSSSSPRHIPSTNILTFTDNHQKPNDFRAVSFDGHLFKDIDFSDSDFTDANLSECQFIQCSFARAILVDTCFIDSLCIECDFTNAQFKNTDVTNAQFISCHLSEGIQNLMRSADFINTSHG